MATLPSYDIQQSYEWNYANAPMARPGVEVPQCPGDWEFCGIPVDSPLGVPAGPLLNSSWVLEQAVSKASMPPTHTRRDMSCNWACGAGSMDVVLDSDNRIAVPVHVGKQA